MAHPNLKRSGFVFNFAKTFILSLANKTKCRCFFDERWPVKRHIAGLTSIYSSVNILIGMNELRFASVLHTFDASKV